VLDIDVLDSSVELIIFGKRNGPLIVSVDNCSTKAGISRVNLLEEPLEPDSFLGSVRLTNIFRFTRGQGYRRLTFGGPGDRGTSKAKNVSGRRSTGVWIPGPIRVRIAREWL
jgi:hypothetical protein